MCFLQNFQPKKEHLDGWPINQFKFNSFTINCKFVPKIPIMKKIFISIAIAGSLFSFSSCKDNKSSESINLTREITFTKQGELSLLKAENDSIIAELDIEIADDSYKTQTGLMYRQSMEPDQAMLFVFPDEQIRCFYMKNTHFALDILYINSKKEIVSIRKNALPLDETTLPSEA